MWVLRLTLDSPGTFLVIPGKLITWIFGLRSGWLSDKLDLISFIYSMEILFYTWWDFYRTTQLPSKPRGYEKTMNIYPNPLFLSSLKNSPNFDWPFIYFNTLIYRVPKLSDFYLLLVSWTFCSLSTNITHFPKDVKHICKDSNCTMGVIQVSEIHPAVFCVSVPQSLDFRKEHRPFLRDRA